MALWRRRRNCGASRPGAARRLRAQPGVTVVDLDGAYAVFDLAAGVDDQSVLRAVVDRGPVRAFRPPRYPFDRPQPGTPRSPGPV
ncbi:hypothetical protein [Micromonospora inyonensis]|uniref:hypothetical protein n=1 Tax=Micromonospora inyonensis TaxID=47866 RepID=UPI003CCBFD5A